MRHACLVCAQATGNPAAFLRALAPPAPARVFSPGGSTFHCVCLASLAHHLGSVQRGTHAMCKVLLQPPTLPWPTAGAQSLHKQVPLPLPLLHQQGVLCSNTTLTVPPGFPCWNASPLRTGLSLLPAASSSPACTTFPSRQEEPNVLFF